MMPWFERDLPLYKAVQEAVDRHLQKLHLYQEGEKIFLRGGIVIEESGMTIARYSVELEFPEDYPKSDPIVRETAGEIPKTANNHFFDDGRACLFLPEERRRHCPSNCTIDQFVNGPVRSFFEWHVYRKLTGKLPPGGEWKHGLEGTLQFYFAESGSDDIRVVMVFLKYLTAKKIRNQWPCYCGGGRKLQECHLDKITSLRERLDRKRTETILLGLMEAKQRVLSEQRACAGTKRRGSELA